MTCQSLRNAQIQRREFNPASKQDLQELKFFKTNNKWKDGCPFLLTDPFIEVPAMCNSLYTDYMLAKMK